MKWFVIIIGLTTPLFAQLVWESKHLDLTPSLTDTNIVAHFKFRNAGTKSIGIYGIKTSCECTTASLAKKIYKPGEKGEVVVNFNFGSRHGLQSKAVLLETDDSREPLPTLTMSVAIPELIKITPSFVYWKRGEEKKPKTLKIQVLWNQPVKVLSAVSTDPRLPLTLKTIVEGKEYAMVINPVDTETPASSTIVIQVDYPPRTPTTFLAYASIK